MRVEPRAGVTYHGSFFVLSKPQQPKQRPSTAGSNRKTHKKVGRHNIKKRQNRRKTSATQRPSSAPPKRPSFHVRTHLRRKRENSNCFNFIVQPPPLIRLPSLPSLAESRSKARRMRKVPTPKTTPAITFLRGTSIPYEWWQEAADRGDKKAAEILKTMTVVNAKSQQKQDKLLLKLESQLPKKPRFSVEFPGARSCFGIYS